MDALLDGTAEADMEATDSVESPKIVRSRRRRTQYSPDVRVNENKPKGTPSTRISTNKVERIEEEPKPNELNSATSEDSDQYQEGSPVAKRGRLGLNQDPSSEKNHQQGVSGTPPSVAKVTPAKRDNNSVHNKQNEVAITNADVVAFGGHILTNWRGRKISAHNVTKHGVGWIRAYGKKKVRDMLRVLHSQGLLIRMIDYTQDVYGITPFSSLSDRDKAALKRCYNICEY